MECPSVCLSLPFVVVPRIYTIWNKFIACFVLFATSRERDGNIKQNTILSTDLLINLQEVYVIHDFLTIQFFWGTEPSLWLWSKKEVAGFNSTAGQRINNSSVLPLMACTGHRYFAGCDRQQSSVESVDSLMVKWPSRQLMMAKNFNLMKYTCSWIDFAAVCSGHNQRSVTVDAIFIDEALFKFYENVHI